MSKVVLFPVANLAEATAYADGCNAHYAANSAEDPGGTFTYAPRPDFYGQHVTAFYGEVVNGLPFEEPAECLALRATGLVAAMAVWPDEET
jgi:hypothetical protein